MQVSYLCPFSLVYLWQCLHCLLICCRLSSFSTSNKLVECVDCHKHYHQQCHFPPVTDMDLSDPRFVWYCSACEQCITTTATILSVSLHLNQCYTNVHSFKFDINGRICCFVCYRIEIKVQGVRLWVQQNLQVPRVLWRMSVLCQLKIVDLIVMIFLISLKRYDLWYNVQRLDLFNIL